MPIRTDKRLGVEANASQVTALVGQLSGESVLLATHGEVIASLHAALTAEGVDLDGPGDWPKGSIWVLEARKGKVRSGKYIEPA